MKSGTEMSKKEELDLKEKQRQNQISILSIAVTFLIAIVSLFWNALLQRQATNTSNVVETTRVENGTVRSNYNGDDFQHPWRQWEAPVTPTTVFIGVQREVVFDRPFSSQPKITLGLSQFDLPPLETVLMELGFSTNDPKLSERIRHVHIYTEVGDESAGQFTIRVGIGLPTEAARALSKHLENTEVDQEFLNAMRRYQQVDDRSSSLNPGEKWMANFYRTVGTIGVTWIAEAAESANGKKQ